MTAPVAEAVGTRATAIGAGTLGAVVTLSFPYRVTGLLESSPNGWRWRLCQGAEPATT